MEALNLVRPPGNVIQSGKRTELLDWGSGVILTKFLANPRGRNDCARLK